jgi:hypothetical protein
MSTLISRASALVLLIGGVALLFVPDAVLPRLVPGYPAAALWLGQLLGAAWLGVAALNWLNRSAVLGGLYRRPVVFTNLVLYFVSAMVLLKVAQRTGFSVVLVALAVPAVVLAIVYGALLLRGPFERDLDGPAGS